MAVITKITFFISAVRHWDTTIVTQRSMFIKKLLAGYVLGVWAYCIYGLITTPDLDQKKSDQFVVIVEWNSVLVNLLWVLTFVMEWKEMNFCLDFYPKS
jgi:phage shock protein PspC (stress-responsive transcriptional regulator)